jgi:hypothetical protein
VGFGGDSGEGVREEFLARAQRPEKALRGSGSVSWPAEPFSEISHP